MSTKKTQAFLHVRVVEADGIRAYDTKAHESYAYCKVKVRPMKPKTKFRTRTVRKSLHPVWDEIFTFQLLEGWEDDEPSIYLKVQHARHIFKDQFLGLASVSVREVQRAGGVLQGWFELCDADGDDLLDNVDGRVFISAVLDTDVAMNQDTTAISSKKYEQYRRELMEKRLAPLRDEPLESVPLSVLIGTWNVGNKPPAENLIDWITSVDAPAIEYLERQELEARASLVDDDEPVDSHPRPIRHSTLSNENLQRQSSGIPGPKVDHDLVVIGAQECKYDARPQYKTCHADWLAQLSKALPGYRLVAHHSLWQTRICVFASPKVEVAPYISHVRDGESATGVAGVGKNKGASAVSLIVRGTRLCFINSHLAAHQHKSNRRNEDVRNIVKELRLGEFRGIDVLHEFHHVFWFGDLNYRLDYGDQGDDKSPSEEQFHEMVRLIQTGRDGLEELLQHDQLHDHMHKRKNVFSGFQEGEITFNPTFKVKREPGVVYTKKRSPAWCDRVLWRSNPIPDGQEVEQLAYTSCEDVASSDHKPVAALFKVPTFYPAPGVTNIRGTCHVVITELSGANLLPADLSGKSDPYLVFSGPDVSEPFETAHKVQTLEPVWKDNEIPQIRMLVNTKRRLRDAIIFVQVVDFDTVGADDPMGQALLPLRDYVFGEDDTFPDDEFAEHEFQLPVHYGGQPKGVLQGKIKLVWERGLVASESY